MSLISCELACQSHGFQRLVWFFVLLSWTAVAVSRLVWERPAPVCCPATHSSRDPATGDLIFTSERKKVSKKGGEGEREREREGGERGTGRERGRKGKTKKYGNKSEVDPDTAKPLSIELGGRMGTQTIGILQGMTTKLAKARGESSTRLQLSEK